MVSADKDVTESMVDPAKLLKRSVGGEVGQAVWERITGTRHLGFNVYDANSSRVNNGYDVVWGINVDADMDKVISMLETNPQFEPKSHVSIPASPIALREFLVGNKTTPSGLSGTFCYIGSVFGEDEVRTQYQAYRKSRGKEAVGLDLMQVK